MDAAIAVAAATEGAPAPIATRDLCKAAWLAMYRQGGWWALGEVAEELGVADDKNDRQRLGYHLRGLHNDGYLAARPNERLGRMEYSLQPTCYVPPFICIGDIAL